MAVVPPSNFTCGQSKVYPGETITCTWTAGSGFQWYRILVAIPDHFAAVYIDDVNQTSHAIAIDDDFCKSAGGSVEDLINGTDLVFTIEGGTGPHLTPTEQIKGDESTHFTLIVFSYPPSDPPSITVSDIIHGESAQVIWEASTAIAEPISGYTLQRSVNGGPFETIYSGPELSFTDNGVDTYWVTAQYRVQANSTGGDSDWTTSTITPVLSSITLPPGGRLTQLENRNAKPVFPLTVTEGIFRQSDGKSLERILKEMGSGNAGPSGSQLPAGGTVGQILAKRSNSDYDTGWIDAPQSGGTTEPGTGGVRSFNGRTGAVAPQSGDYTAAQVGAVPTSRKVNGQTLNSDITIITCGTADLTAGSSPLAAGTLYGVYEV